MNTKLRKIIISVSVVVIMVAFTFTLTSCKKEKKTTYFDNENDALVFSTQAVDKLFNPFFSTSATDSSVVGMTQIGMLGNDKNGKPTFGEEEAVITKDLEIKVEGQTEDVDLFTTYYFVLKNNVKFSNNTPLTIKDVLFNYYVYLDKSYTGSATIYSTDIVGLEAYRTDTLNKKDQENFNKKYETQAATRVESLVEAIIEVLDEVGTDKVTNDKFIEKLEERTTIGEAYANIVDDYEYAVKLFGEELETDYSNSIDSYEDFTFKDSKNKEYKNLFTTDVEVFLYNEGYITWNKDEGKLYSSFTNNVEDFKDSTKWTKEKAIEMIKTDMIPYKMDQVTQYWATSSNLYEYIINKSIEDDFKDRDYKVDNIEGIKFANRTEPITVNGKTYAVPQYEADGTVKDGYNEVLSIKINNIDPKAIWNFALGVAPMYYYSDSEHIEKFDYEKNFGVQRASITFMQEVVNSTEKVGLPVGAGAYVASKSSGGITNVKATDFYDNGVIYYERNPYFVMGEPVIKKVRFQVVPSNQMTTNLYNGKVDFIEPNAKKQIIDELAKHVKDGVKAKAIQTAGYGYIGVNAGKIADIKIRQLIMHSVNTQECVDYYVTTAQAIHRPMSLSSWAYPTGCTAYYPYIGGKVPADLTVVNPDYREFVTLKGKKTGDTFTNQEITEFFNFILDKSNYTYIKDSDGVLKSGKNRLEYIFTIAGSETDHPAYNALLHSSEILNRNGFNVTVKPDSNALRKLSTGDLTVWAAAWGSAIDPDMYQIYHKESKATSTQNWGYRQIEQNLQNKYDYEKGIVEELSDYIDKARRTNDENQRAAIYSKALDLVMQLAVELPTYQRDDLFAYNAKKIDSSTLTPDSECSSFKGLTSDLHTVSLYTEK